MRLAAAACAVLLAAGLCACGQAGKGTALANPNKVSVGAIAMRPGDEIGFLFVELYDTSRSPLTFQSISVRGPGIGKVVRLVQEDIAASGPPARVLPGAIYQTDPPAMWLGHSCHVQLLRPVRGYVLKPKQLVLLWEVFRGVAPGRWSVPTHPVTYTQGGAAYREVITQEDYGVISRNARFVPMDPAQQRCLSKAKPLAGALPAGTRG